MLLSKLPNWNLSSRASHAPGDHLRYRFQQGRRHIAPRLAVAPCLASAVAPRIRRCLGNGQKVSLTAVRKLSGTRLGRKRLAEATHAMPPMSKDGGSEEEFEEYWQWFKEPQCFGSWIERRTHPQVSVLPYWYNIDTQETIFDAPEKNEKAKVLPSLEPLKLEGLIGELSVKELRAKLQDPEELRSLNLTDTMLARRAIWEYETFIPRVLSWHDYQYNTFWFFIEERDSKSNYGRGERGYFGPQSDEAKKLFAHDSFFDEVAALANQRFQQIHPINLVYLLWTFTRAGVQAQKFFNDAADHFCDGLLPALDRCGLCTLVWCYSRQKIRHNRLFQRAAQELQRTIRVRSLAPRNFQNTMIAYRWYGKGRDTEAMAQQLALWLPRLLDDHDERRPKLRRGAIGHTDDILLLRYYTLSIQCVCEWSIYSQVVMFRVIWKNSQMISRKLFKSKRAMEDPGNLQLCETVRKDVMFSYTCRDGSAGLFSRKDSVRKLFWTGSISGSEVPADAFRINGLELGAQLVIESL